MKSTQRNAINVKHSGLFKKDALVHVNQARAVAGLKPLTEEEFIKPRRQVSKKS